MLTIPLLSIAVAIGVFWKVYAYMAFRKIPKDLKHLPGPKGYPFLGSVLEFPKEFSYHKFKEWSDQYGPIFQVNILGKPHVIISSEDMANDLLALRGAHYSDRPPIVMLHELISATGNLGTSPLNKYWRNSRKLSATALTSRSLEKWNPMQIGEAARLVLDLLSTPDQYEYLFERYSSIVTLRLLYNKDMSLAEERDHVDRITTIVRTLERTVAPGAYLVDFLPILKYLPEVLAPFKTEAKALHEFEYSYFRRLVAEAEETYEPADRLEKRPRGLVHKFFDNKQSWDLTDFEVSYCMGTLLQGGSGTTSSAMQSYCLAMWHYPEWQLKVQKELDEVVGDDRLPSFDDWPNLPTVRAAMKETLRWRPVVPGGIPHYSTKDDSYKGYFIPKGAVLHANQFAMFRDEKVYPDAEAFNPERWLNPKYPTFQTPLTQFPNLKRFVSFGFGRRICPGLESAERSLFIEISMLMWACNVEKKRDANGKVIPVPWYDTKPGNNTGPNPFHFNLQPRSGRRLEVLKAVQRQGQTGVTSKQDF